MQPDLRNTVPFPAADDAAERRRRALASAKLPARLPPLNLFRTFDAAARHNSFRLAADELCVTPSAVSQQIRQLEEFLDIRLFRRLTRRVELTSEGGALAGTVQEVLAMLNASCEKLRDPTTPAVVCINAMPAIALRWLVSRLRAFMEADEQIKLSLLASSDPLDFERQDVDLGIRWGNGSFPGMRAERLAADRIIAVASPEMATRARTPDDLRLLPLLQAQGGVAWTRWFEAAGVSGKPISDGVFFNEASLLLEAAAFGQGVALTSSLLVENDLRTGRLIRLFDVAPAAEEGFYILSSQTLGDKPAIARVREWLQVEALRSVEAAGRIGHSEGTLHPFPR